MAEDSSPIPFTSTPFPQDLMFLDERIIEHNLAITAIADYAPMTAILRDHQGVIVAGVHGWTWGGAAELTHLWVHPRMRRQRVGTRLLNAAETLASSRGSSQIIFEAFDFGPLPMFFGRGYTKTFAVDGYPRGHQKIYLRKPLA